MSARLHPRDRRRAIKAARLEIDAQLRQLETAKRYRISLLGPCPAWKDDLKIIKVLDQRLILDAYFEFIEDVTSAGYWFRHGHALSSQKPNTPPPDFNGLIDALRGNRDLKKFADLLKSDLPDEIRQLLSDRAAGKIKGKKGRPKERVSVRKARSKSDAAAKYYEDISPILRTMYPKEKFIKRRARELAVRKYGVELSTLEYFKRRSKKSRQRFHEEPSEEI